jgi:hypothetical protein
VTDNTRRILGKKDVWAAVQACAELLLQQGNITGEEMRQLAKVQIISRSHITLPSSAVSNS